MSWFNRNKTAAGRAASTRQNRQSQLGRDKNSARAGRVLNPEVILFWMRRFGLIITAVVFCGWMAAWFFLSDADSKTQDWVTKKFYALSIQSGFSIRNILVQGRVHADRDTILALLDTQRGESLFSVDLRTAKNQLEQLSWVKQAMVQRRYPDTIYIKIMERTPMALWQRNKRVSVIDAEGVVLRDHDLEPFQDFIILTGEEANKRGQALISALAAEPDLYQKVEGAALVSGRRWDLTLTSGAVVKLPEENIEATISQLAMFQREDGLLDKNIVSIDTRVYPKITIETHPGAVQRYQAQYLQGGETPI